MRSELLRIVNTIDYMQENGGVNVGRGELGRLRDVASELAHFGHRAAADTVFSASAATEKQLAKAAAGEITWSAIESHLISVRNSFRSISPSAATYLPWGRI